MIGGAKRKRRETTVETSPETLRDDAPSKQKLRVWLRLLRSTRAIEAELRERLRARFDSTLPRFDVMAALYRAGQVHAIAGRVAKSGNDAGLTMTALSRHLLVSNGNATVIVERLVQDGLVARMTATNDRRSTVVRLTPDGSKLFRAMADAHESWIAEILADLSSHEADYLVQLLNRRSPAFSVNGELA